MRRDTDPLIPMLLCIVLANVTAGWVSALWAVTAFGWVFFTVADALVKD